MKLEEIEKLCEEATPGDFHCDDIGNIYTARNVKIGDVLGGIDSFGNARLLAASRTLMPKLVKVVRAAKSLSDCMCEFSDYPGAWGVHIDALDRALAELEAEQP